MFCQKCGNQIPDGSVNCNFCGAPQQNAPVQQPPFAQPPVMPPVQPTPPTPQKEKNNKTVLIAIIAALVVIIAVIVIVFVVPKSKDDDDTTKKPKETTITTENRTEERTNAPTPAIDDDDAVEAVDDYLSYLNSKKLFAVLGKNASELGEYEDAALLICDAFLFSYDYSISDTQKIDDSTFEVKVKFTVPDNNESVIYSIIEEADKYSEPATEEEAFELIADIVGDVLASSTVSWSTQTTTMTAEYVNGKWNVTLPQDAATTLLDCAITFFQMLAS